MPEINGLSVPFLPVGGAKALKQRPFIEGSNVASGNSKFDDVFAKELGKVQFSGHAKARIESRDLVLSNGDLQKLEAAVEKAKAKGSNDSLILMDEKAFIVNIPNNKVITIMDRDRLSDNVITKIDSAVFA
jgi:flagellar operon protein